MITYYDLLFFPPCRLLSHLPQWIPMCQYSRRHRPQAMELQVCSVNVAASADLELFTIDELPLSNLYSTRVTGNQIPYGTMIGIVVGSVLAFIVVVLAAVTAVLYRRRSAAQQNEIPIPPALAFFYPVNGAQRDSIPELTQSQASSP